MTQLDLSTVYVGPCDPERFILTVRNYCKWYSLVLLGPGGTVDTLTFDELENVAIEMGVSAYVDHVPNPAVVEKFAEVRGYVMCQQSLEMIMGRWVYEVKA